MAGRIREWGRVGGILTALSFGLVALASFAAEENPFLPPDERQADVERRLAKRMDLAFADLETRLTRSVVDAVEGKNNDDPLGRAIHDALNRRPAVEAQPLPALPALPPLPNLGAAGNGVVPPGAVFIGCLDGKAFFQDRAGSSFLVDPRALPPGSGGGATCRS